MHLISYFVSYEKVLMKYLVFVPILSNMDVPNNIYEALKKLEFEKAVEEEMRGPK